MQSLITAWRTSVKKLRPVTHYETLKSVLDAFADEVNNKFRDSLVDPRVTTDVILNDVDHPSEGAIVYIDITEWPGSMMRIMEEGMNRGIQRFIDSQEELITELVKRAGIPPETLAKNVNKPYNNVYNPRQSDWVRYRREIHIDLNEQGLIIVPLNIAIDPAMHSRTEMRNLARAMGEDSLKGRIKKPLCDWCMDTSLPYQLWAEREFKRYHAKLWVERDKAKTAKRWHSKSYKRTRRDCVQNAWTARWKARYNLSCEDCVYSIEHELYDGFCCTHWQSATNRMDYPYRDLPHFGDAFRYYRDDEGKVHYCDAMREIRQHNLACFCPLYKERNFLGTEDLPLPIDCSEWEIVD